MGAGHSRIVRVDYEGRDLKVDYFGGTPGSYAGLDRYGRVVDQKWYHGSGGQGTEMRDRFQYAYGTASNRSWRRNVVASAASQALDQYYEYDGLSRRIVRVDVSANPDVTYDDYYNAWWQLLETRKTPSGGMTTTYSNFQIVQDGWLRPTQATRSTRCFH